MASSNLGERLAPAPLERFILVRIPSIVRIKPSLSATDERIIEHLLDTCYTAYRVVTLTRRKQLRKATSHLADGHLLLLPFLYLITAAITNKFFSYRLEYCKRWRRWRKTWKRSSSTSAAWVRSTSIQDACWRCWHPVCQVVWQRGRLQCNGDGPSRPVHGRLVQLLQASFLAQNGLTARRSIGTFSPAAKNAALFLPARYRMTNLTKRPSSSLSFHVSNTSIQRVSSIRWWWWRCCWQKIVLTRESLFVCFHRFHPPRYQTG